MPKPATDQDLAIAKELVDFFRGRVDEVMRTRASAGKASTHFVKAEGRTELGRMRNTYVIEFDDMTDAPHMVLAMQGNPEGGLIVFVGEVDGPRLKVGEFADASEQSIARAVDAYFDALRR